MDTKMFLGLMAFQLLLTGLNRNAIISEARGLAKTECRPGNSRLLKPSEYTPPCKWFGTAPLCNGKCPDGWKLCSTDTAGYVFGGGFGGSCDTSAGWWLGLTNEKALCCK